MSESNNKWACKKCPKIFKQKVDYDRHANRKNPCSEQKYSSKDPLV